MSTHIHPLWPDFLKDVSRYEQCESDWSEIIAELASSAGSAEYWEQSRKGVAGDGITRLPLTGNPIAHAQSVRLNRSLRVLQHQTFGDAIDFSWWTEEEKDSDFIGRGPQFELVISLSPSEESLELAKALLAKWLSPELDVSTFEDFARAEVQKAEAWFRQAAEAGDSAAMTNLATLILHHAVQDLAKAERLFRTAAEAGNADAMVRLGQMLVERSEGDQGETSDLSEAERLYRRAVLEGRPEAMVLLGQFLEVRNSRTAADLDEAERLYRRAAEKGDLDAMFLLGQILETRNGPNAETVRWYRASHGPT